MSYVINRFSGQQLVVLEDGTLDTSTSIGLLGRNYVGYGEVQNENFLFLLENFSNDTPPSRPLSGQTWFNTFTKSLNVYTGDDWAPVGTAIVDSTEPTGFDGGLWYKSTTDQLFVYKDGFWRLVGPEAVEGAGTTRLRAKNLLDSDNINHAVLELLVNGSTLAICTNEQFVINPLNFIPGFDDELKPGINLSSLKSLVGNLTGNADSASILTPGRLINGVFFDGANDITIKSSTTNILTRGTYLTGTNFDGSSSTTWSVDATPNNIIGKVVARDSSGNFEAGTITANLIGNVSGNVTSIGTSTFNIVQANEFVGATLSGNAFTATKLQTPRTINGVLFDGSENINVPVPGASVTGTTLATNIVESSLTSVSTLNNLDVSSSGVFTIGGPSGISAPFVASLETGVTPVLQSTTGTLKLQVNDISQPNLKTDVSLVNSSQALTLGGINAPAVIPKTDSVLNLGISTRKWNNVYANFFVGTATSAQYADLAEKYVADNNYESGTVLEFGGDFEVTLASNATNKVAGVVSTNPAYLMNSDCFGKYTSTIALQGRVPCKVTGIVKKGDMMISAGNGYAKSCANPLIGTVIGKALQDFHGNEGTIEIAVGRI